MALVRCPKCNVQLSDAHETCPYCHTKIRKADAPQPPKVVRPAEKEEPFYRKHRKAILGTLCVVLSVLLVYYSGMLVCLFSANRHIQNFDYDAAKNAVSIYGGRLYDRVAQAYKDHMRQTLLGPWYYTDSASGMQYVFDFQEDGVLNSYIYGAEAGTYGVSEYQVKVNQVVISAPESGVSVSYQAAFYDDYVELRTASSVLGLTRLQVDESAQGE